MKRGSVASIRLRRGAGMRARLTAFCRWVTARAILALVMSIAAILSLMFKTGPVPSILAGYLFADGILALACGGRTPQPQSRCMWMMLEGLLDLAAGVAVLLLPVTASYALIIVIGVWAATSGMAFFQASFRIERSLGGLVVALAGAASTFAGLLLLAWPSRDDALLGVWFAAYAALFAILLGTAAYRSRSMLN